MSKAFDITPLPTFAGLLAMNVNVSADGSQICSAHSLLSSAPHFGMSLRDAATWLGNAAVHVAQHWEPQLRDLGVAAAHTAQFEPAFVLATELTKESEALDEALTTIEHSRRKGRRYSQSGK